jgi:alpha-amylase
MFGLPVTALALVAQALSLFTSPTLALDNTSIRLRTVYQVLTDRFARTDLSTSASCPAGTYCGGTWQGLISRLDYIQGMGFDTVWISPIVDNIEDQTKYGLPYHGYWTRDPTKLNSHFGTEADLLALSAALHAKGMYLMIDIVVNHVGTTQTLASFDPKGQYGPFTTSDFHHPTCFIDYSNATSVEFCSLGDNNVPLPDIYTEKASVKAFWNSWIKGVVKKYSIDAIRYVMVSLPDIL